MVNSNLYTGDAYSPRPIRPVLPPEPEPEEEEEAPREKSDVEELTQITKGDIRGDDRDNLSQELDEKDMDDLFGVSEEDIMGEPPRPPKPKPLFRRTVRPYNPQPPNVLGIR